MFGGMRIVWTALFAKILLKITLEKRHFVGCGLAIIGVTIVGSSVFMGNDPEETTSQVIVILIIEPVVFGLCYDADFIDIWWLLPCL